MLPNLSIPYTFEYIKVSKFCYSQVTNGFNNIECKKKNVVLYLRKLTPDDVLSKSFTGSKILTFLILTLSPLFKISE